MRVCNRLEPVPHYRRAIAHRDKLLPVKRGRSTPQVTDRLAHHKFVSVALKTNVCCSGKADMWPISTRVNKPENDEASIVEPIKLPAGVGAS